MAQPLQDALPGSTHAVTSWAWLEEASPSLAPRRGSSRRGGSSTTSAWRGEEEKSSICSLGQKERFSHSLRRHCSVARQTRSTPMRAAAMESHASLAEGLSASDTCIPSGTQAMMASSARRSSWYRRSPYSTASQIWRPCILSRMSVLHSW